MALTDEHLQMQGHLALEITSQSYDDVLWRLLHYVQEDFSLISGFRAF